MGRESEGLTVDKYLDQLDVMGEAFDEMKRDNERMREALNLARVMKKKLSMAHYAQMLSYATAADEEGFYFGNKKQFEKRHKEIVSFLYEALGWPEEPTEAA